MRDSKFQFREPAFTFAPIQASRYCLCWLKCCWNNTLVWAKRGEAMTSKYLPVCALIFSSFCSTNGLESRSAGLKHIRIGMPNRGATTLGLSAAQTYGFFRAQGLFAELIVMRPSTSLQTLMSGDLDFSTALASGARASVSGSAASHCDDLDRRSRLFAGRAAGDPAHRRSQRQDLSGFRRGRVYRRRRALVLKKYGLVPEVDVRLRALFGNHPLRLSALQAGQIDGTVMSMPYNKMAVKDGFQGARSSARNH